MIEFCVQRQHSAMFVAVIAPPDIFDEIDIHPSAAVTAERAVHIDAVRLLAPDPQVQQFHDLHDAEGKFIRVRAHLSFLPSYPRRGPYQPAFCSESKTSWAAARTMLFLLLPGIR